MTQWFSILLWAQLWSDWRLNPASLRMYVFSNLPVNICMWDLTTWPLLKTVMKYVVFPRNGRRIRKWPHLKRFFLLQTFWGGVPFTFFSCEHGVLITDLPRDRPNEVDDSELAIVIEDRTLRVKVYFVLLVVLRLQTTVYASDCNKKLTRDTASFDLWKYFIWFYPILYYSMGVRPEHFDAKTLHLCSDWEMTVLWLVAQSCPTLFDPKNYSLPGSSVHGILQAGILEWVSCPPPEDFPSQGIKPRSPTWLPDYFYRLSHQGSPWSACQGSDCLGLISSPSASAVWYWEAYLNSPSLGFF